MLQVFLPYGYGFLRMEKITALIPTYRRPQLLHRAIVSVLRQTYTNLQVFVFDNASGDTTAEVVTKLGENDALSNILTCKSV